MRRRAGTETEAKRLDRHPMGVLGIEDVQAPGDGVVQQAHDSGPMRGAPSAPRGASWTARTRTTWSGP